MVVVVTGAATGIGAAVCDKVLSEGGCVVGLDLSPSEAAPSERQLRFTCDVRDADLVAEAVAAGADRFGGVDALVNNAGVNAYFDAVSMSEQDWDSVMDVDLRAAWLCVRAVVPHLRRRGGGSIVNISSIHARMTTTGMFPYAVAKAGVEGLTRSLALDLARDGIRVNAVAPGWTRTQLVEEWFERQTDATAAEDSVLRAHPLGRIAEPAEVASVVAFALGAASSAMTGSVLTVDCGLSSRFSVT
jgi:NAD(P)-dependent dehydrogenase (short-subunit alcohol dehydrogenase family)